MQRLLSVVFLLFLCNTCFGTHLTGGFFTSTHTLHGWNCEFRIYRDAHSGTDFDDQIDIGLYDVKSGKCLDVYEARSPQTRPYQPKTIPENAGYITRGFEEAVYKFFVPFPSDTFNEGFYLMFIRCCRMPAIMNIKNIKDEGTTYLHFLPPAKFINHSPQQSNLDVYIPAGDTVSLNIGFAGQDGDKLVYQLSQPIAGGSSHIDSIIPRMPDLYTQPRFLEYKEGFSKEMPLGKDSYVALDSLIGKLTFYSAYIGIYQMAIEILEYRQDSLIATSRQEFLVYAGNPFSGIGKDKETSAYHVYPNPFRDGLTVNGPADASTVKYQLFNALGQQVSAGTMQGSSSLALSDLPKGLYYLQIENTSQPLKLIKE